MGKKIDKAGNKLDIKKEGKEKTREATKKRERERESEKYLHITFSGCYPLKY